MAYVYKHIREDNNEIFYIGIGSDDSYKRANTITNRNKYWYKITKKTDFIVEIIYDDLSWEEACLKEIELIELYGRKCNNSGILVNVTKGGEGFKQNHSEESKLKIQLFFKDKTYENIHGDNADLEKKKRSDGVKKYWNNISSEEKELRRLSHVGKKYKHSGNEKLITCPNCGTEGRGSLMFRWHFENCKKIGKYDVNHNLICIFNNMDELCIEHNRLYKTDIPKKKFYDYVCKSSIIKINGNQFYYKKI